MASAIVCLCLFFGATNCVEQSDEFPQSDYCQESNRSVTSESEEDAAE